MVVALHHFTAAQASCSWDPFAVMTTFEVY